MQAKDIQYITFSGGGARGVSFAGALSEMQALLRFDFSTLKGTSGTSVGALLAAGLIVGERTVEEIVEIVSKTALVDLINPSFSSLIFTWGFESPSNIRAWVDSHLGGRELTFQQLKDEKDKTLKIMVTNLNLARGERLDHETAPNMAICDAVVMSMALPPLFAPIEYKKQMYVDGGIFMNFPIELFPAEHTLGFRIMWDDLGEGEIRTAETYFSRLTYCALVSGEAVNWSRMKQAYRDHTVKIHCNNVSTIQWRPSDDAIRKTIEDGRRAMRTFIHERNLHAI